MSELPRIHVVGIEPEGPDPDRPPLSTLLGACRLLCGGRRHLEGLSGRISPGSRILPVTTNVPEVVEALKEFLRRGEEGVAVVLATGDPLYHGIGGPIAREIPRGHLAFYPATTLVQRAFSLLGEAWEGAQVASIHGKKEEPALGPGRWIFYTNGPKGPEMLVDMAFRQRLRIMEMIVLEEIGLPEQRVTTFDKVVVEEIRSREFRTLNMVVMTLDQ